MFSIIVAVLFVMKIYSNSVHSLPKMILFHLIWCIVSYYLGSYKIIYVEFL